MIWVPPEEYAKVTGVHFAPLNAKAFEEALRSAPFYPGRTTPISNTYKAPSTLLPPLVFNTMYLPPIGDQGMVGSCNAWSSTYYVWTYMLNWWRNHPYPSNPSDIMNPTFTYNLINGGEDQGSIPEDAMNLISTIGAVPLDKFPVYTYNLPSDYAWVWPNLTQWMLAPHNSADYLTYLGGYDLNVPGEWHVIDLSNDTQWNYLLQLLAQGYIVQFAYPVNLVFFVATDMDASSFLRWLDTLAERTKNQTFINYVKEHFTENKTFIQEANYYFTYDRYTITNSMVNWTFRTWWKVWSTYYQLYHHSKAPFVFGGHAVTIVGYDMNRETTDGKGVLIIANSWGSDWGDHGYFYISFDAARFGAAYENSDQTAWVYVPKAANYTPELMAVVGIKHPIRGETFSGIVIFNYTPPYPVLATPVKGGLDVGVIPGGSNKPYYTPFFNFQINYLWWPIQWIPPTVDIHNATQLEKYIVDYAKAIARKYNMTYEQVLENYLYFPQVHPYPKSPMAFDISDDIEYLIEYIEETNTTPLNATFYVTARDILPDNVTGQVYNFTILLNLNGHYVPLAAVDKNVTIPDGGSVNVSVTVPLVKYENAPNNVSLNFGTFNVSIFSLIPLKGAEIIIGGKSYQLSAEEGGYYYYATAIAQKLNLPAGTYNYTVVVTYPNGKEVKLPTRTVTIKEPVVYIKSPEPKVYNTSEIELAVKVVDVLNVTNVTAKVGGKEYALTYNATTGLYTAELNLTNGKYTLTVTAVDEKNATGKATVNFVVSTEAKVKTVKVNNETNVTVGVVGGSANVTAENNTVVANVSTSKGTVTVEVPVVNNVQSVVVNASAINSVVTGKSNASLAAGWNASVSVTTTAKYVKTENYKKLYSVTIRANVTLGENGVAVVALRDINISKIYVWKNGQKIPLTTDKSNPLGYYYKEGNIIFVVLKEDPVIEADGYFEVPVQVSRSHGVSLTALNFLAYRWYNMYLQEFNELYQKALQMNVSNETLKLALQYNETAATYYQKALELSNNNIILHLGDLQLLVPLRKAYLNEVKAVEILKEALEKLESQGS
ncbi:C1 family peptidase [Thermococcus henrietii]|uniref:C1 family peptidase n=1 Tax=Thermococcus henrietii TaxID=2016361 RepID=UPI001CB7A89D|nr:C1 family peptidase [Thermococcus henrietii]